MLGSDARMRLSLVISWPPGASGTLKSTRMKRRLPFKSRSRMERVLIFLLFCLFRSDPENRAVFLRQFGGAKITSAEDVLGITGSQTPRVLAGQQLISEADHAGVGFFDLRAHNHLIVIAGRSIIPAVYFDDGQQNPGRLQIAISAARHPAVLHAPNFHPNQIVGVVNDAHLVGFGVTYPQPCVDEWHESLIIADRLALQSSKPKRFSGSLLLCQQRAHPHSFFRCTSRYRGPPRGLSGSSARGSFGVRF